MEQIMKHVEFIPFTTCWIWNAKIAKNGYGHMSVGGKTELAHRESYKRAKGQISDGLQVDHLCKTRACVNPNHLEAVTQKINLERSGGITAMNSAKTVCKNGHDLTGDNVYIKPNGARNCKACLKDANRRHREVTRA